jgi:hypothetical protein
MPKEQTKVCGWNAVKCSGSQFQNQKGEDGLLNFQSCLRSEQIEFAYFF